MDIVREVVLTNKLGMHARAAAAFVQQASEFGSEIQICKDGNFVSAKSIIGLLMLALSTGEKFDIVASGEDAEMAIDALQGLINNKFGEE